MLLETDAFRAGALSARIDAYNDMKAAARQARITVPGQIRIDPRRTAKDAEKAPPAKHGPIIRGEKRQHVVKQIATTLKTSHLSPFEFEGACRHGVRAELCLEGYNWKAADIEAGALVAESLLTINARRPSYEEGQREYSVPPDYCAWCGSPITEHGQPGSRMSFCNDVCARSAIVARDLQRHRRESRAFSQAYMVIMRSRNPACQCDECGKTFRPLEVGARYCSKSCASRARVRYLGATPHGFALLADRECRHCGSTFHPSDAKSVYCSEKCRHEGQRVYVHDVECQHCKKAFRPKNATNKFCSRECFLAHDHHPEREHRCTCEWCGGAFHAATPTARFCSKTCFQIDYRHRLGNTPQRLNTAVFDHFITIPALAVHLQKGPEP